MKDVIKEKFVIRSEQLSLLKNNPDFLKLYLSSVVTMVGGQLHRFGLPWIIYQLSGSGSLMAINFILNFVPTIFFGVIGGGLSDRFNRKKIMMIGNLFSTIITFLLFVLYNFSSNFSIWFVFIISFILSSIQAIYSPSFRASLPILISKNDLINANSLFTVSMSIINLGGPALAGMIIGFFNGSANILINSFAFLLAGLLIYRINNPFNAYKEDKAKINFNYLVYGFMYILKERWLLLGTFLSIGVLLGAGSIGSLIQFHFLDTMGINGFMFGFSFTLLEFIPMFLIGLYAPFIAKRFSKERLLLTGSYLYAISLILFSLTIIYPLVILAGMLVNAASALITINWTTMIQERTSIDKLGRVSGAVSTIQSLFLPIGGSISSYLVTFMSSQKIFIIFGFIALTFSIITSILPFDKKTYQLKV